MLPPCRTANEEVVMGIRGESALGPSLSSSLENEDLKLNHTKVCHLFEASFDIISKFVYLTMKDFR